ncbi:MULTISPECIES: DUF3575 domain-containing protein [Flavobacterium]|uniref:DUF3575 domain-containing protein n=1 Tax=Flavobacterium algoritolerans TaxID=3041254 RepID=A0ABT6V6S8_9FLAO|nr:MULTISPECIES: DUF3575 domain-containing protein [Flavobacterium]MDI5886908.1 DUF3575 domain-containing protein [Flavobacterium yafengii]MDI5893939.1 DUF3575 domain-containing protein [Flavobacterium algoritolerans]
MKKLFVLICLTFSLSGFSQEKETIDFKRNELKGNALFLVLGAGEIAYERLINEDAGLGVSLFFVKEEDFDTQFSLTPYYRAYFGKKTAAGFFVEGFGMINSGNTGSYSEYDSVNQNYYTTEGKKFTDIALGFGLGAKWIQKRGFIFEINAGIGRNLFNSNSPEVVGRGGITFGYRF